MELRNLTPSDHAAILGLWNAACPTDPLSSELLAEKIWGDADGTFPGCLGMAVNERLVAFAFGVSRLRSPAASPPRRGHVKLMAVDPAHQRRGLGGRLLAILESRLAAIPCDELRVDEAAPNYLHPGLDRANSAALAFFAAHGFEAFGEACNQRVPVTRGDWSTIEDEGRFATEGIEFRRANPSDREPLAAWLADRWPAWIAEVSQTFSCEPISLHVATQGTKYLGFSAYDANNRGIGWFGPMGTDAACRGKGVGRILLWRCLADQKRQGHPHVTIPWVGPTGFYEQHAQATIDRRFVRLRKPLV